MALWLAWCNALMLLRPAFSRQTSFVWFVVCVAGLGVRTDGLGVSSIVRALSLDGRYYAALLRSCRGRGCDIDRLQRCWVRAVFTLFGERIERVAGRPVLIADGKKIAKAGRKMPGVKCLHQQSESNTKPSYIMGHSAQALSILARAGQSMLAVPLGIQIHEGTVFSNRDKRTLFDKLLIQLAGLDVGEPVYLVGDAYYGNGPIIKGLLRSGSHLVSRARRNAVAYYPAPKVVGKRPRGRPRIYGDKVVLTDLFAQASEMVCVPSPVYGEERVTLRVRTVDLLWESAGQLVRFVLVDHPNRGRIVLMCSDMTLAPSEIIRLYGLRFKIEFGFKQAAHVVGSYGYHFWMRDMKPIRWGGKDRYLHRESRAYRDAVRAKLHTYQVFLSMGVIAQGLMHYLSACHTEAVWAAHRTWLRTIRQGVAPSELVVKTALRNALPEFLLGGATTHDLAKFIVERQRRDTADDWPVAA